MVDEFRRLFGSADGIRVFRAPGRVNLIGEHTDYNLGLVLPMALDLATYVATAPSTDGKVRIYSEDKKQMREWDAAAIGECQSDGTWADYPIGVAKQLLRRGFSIVGANLLIRSTVPEGSGLSSSAALEVSCALAFLNGQALPGLELARLCQRAEIDFVGIPCGIMDQYVSVFGREHSAIELDCRSLDHRYVGLPDNVRFVALNTMVKHELAASAYRERVQECARAVERIRQEFPQVESLRDVSPQQIAALEAKLPPLDTRRTRHVVMENRRVDAFREACERGDRSAMGNLLWESHRSLQHDYEVSCAELDFLVETARGIDGVYGARMTGGGFGGCIVAMLDGAALGYFCTEAVRAYQMKYFVVPEIYQSKPSAGATEVNNFEKIPASFN
jgi:galactokinase